EEGGAGDGRIGGEDDAAAVVAPLEGAGAAGHGGAQGLGHAPACQVVHVNLHTFGGARGQQDRFGALLAEGDHHLLAGAGGLVLGEVVLELVGGGSVGAAGEVGGVLAVE